MARRAWPGLRPAAQAGPKRERARWFPTGRPSGRTDRPTQPTHPRRPDDHPTRRPRPTTPSSTSPARPTSREGPHDQTGMYVMHHAFRRDLAAFASSVRATPLGDTDTWGALAPALGAVRRHPAPPPQRRGHPLLAGAARGRRGPRHRGRPRRGARDERRARRHRPARRGVRATGSPPWSSTRARSTATPSTSGSPACARCSTSTCATRRPSCCPWCSG